MNNNKKGFTLIELIVVIIIIGILVLLATPKFLNYIEEAKLTQIIHDIKVSENMVIADHIRRNELPSDFELIKDQSMIDAIENGLLYDKHGKIEENTRRTYSDDTDYYRLSDKFIADNFKTNLKGIFLINKDMSGRYLDKYIPETGENQGADNNMHILKGKFDADLYEDFSIEVFEDRNDLVGNQMDYLNENIGMDMELIKKPYLYMNYKVELIGKYEKGTIIEDINKEYKAVILGFKNKEDINKYTDIIIPPYLDCSCGKKHEVVSIGDRYGSLDEIFKLEDDGEITQSNEAFVFGQNKNIESEIESIIKTVKIPKNVQHIGLGAFKNLGIEEIQFPTDSKIKVIGINAFLNNNAFNLELPESLELILDSSFMNTGKRHRQVKLKGITNEDIKLKSIGYNAFAGANIYTNSSGKNRNIELSDSIEYIGEGAFLVNNIKSYIDNIKLPKNEKYTKISKGTFSNVLMGEELIVPENIELIESRAFRIDTGKLDPHGKPYFNTANKLILMNPKIELENDILFEQYNTFFKEVYTKYSGYSGSYERSYSKDNNEWTYKYTSIDGSNKFVREYNELN